MMKIRSTLLLVVAALTMTVVLGMVSSAAADDQDFTWTHDWVYLAGPPFNDFHATYAGTGGSISRVILWKDSAGGGVESFFQNMIWIDWPDTWVQPGDWFGYDFSTKFAPVEFVSGNITKDGVNIGNILPSGQIEDPDVPGEIIGKFERTFRRSVPPPSLPDEGAEHVPDKVVNVIKEWAKRLGEAVPDGPGAGPGAWTTAANRMADLYWEDATLLPTLASFKMSLYKNTPFTGCFAADSATIRNYFNCHFLIKWPSLDSIPAWHWTKLADNLVSVQGLYVFKVPGQPDVNARFTFVIEKRGDDDKWKIIQHHSSKDPANQAPPPPPCPWDHNGDGVVDWFDVLELLDNWGDCPPGSTGQGGDPGGFTQPKDSSIPSPTTNLR